MNRTTCNSPSKPRSPRPGLTLLELTVVIAVSLLLVGLSFVAARAWKSGADRASCVMNVYKMQEAVRAHSAVSGYHEGQDVSVVNPGSSLFGELVGEGKYFEEVPSCPEEGLYITSGDIVPQYGELYMICSLALSEGHVPDAYETW